MNAIKKPKRKYKPKLSIHERDQLFISHAKLKKYVFDVVNGVIYNKKNNVLGLCGKKAHMLFFAINKNCYSITRSRAIWLYVHGSVMEGYVPSHISNNRFDDSISNLELKTQSEISRKCSITRRSSRIKKKDIKLTVEVVEFARKEILKPDMTYTKLLAMVKEKIGQSVSKPTLILAVQGKTFADVKEPPVLHKPEKERVSKTSAVRIRKPKSVKVIDEIELLNTEISIRTVKSMIRNNPNLSNKAVLKFLKMRNLSELSFQRIASIRKQITESKIN